MANDFSISDIYKEALDNLSSQRKQADAASRAAFAGLSERGNAGYDALSNEAYVNKALADRAFGTAGDQMATLKQRRESNLRNTLGKNERQRRNFEQGVDLAIKNYETRQKADEAIATAQYGAAEAAAHVSQSNFEKQLGLQRQRLEMDKQNSEFSHAFALLGDRKLNEKGFQEITGIKVKKKPRPKSNKLIIECGTEPPKAREGFEIRTTTDEEGVVHYYQVSTKLIEDAKKKGISLYTSVSDSQIASASQEGIPLHTDGSLKSDTQILLEVYGLDPAKGNYDEVYATIEANKEDIIKKYGKAFFWSVSISARYGNMAMKYAPFEGTQYYNNMAILSDLITNSETYIEQYGYERYKGMLSLALGTAEQLYEELEPYAVNPKELQEEGNLVLWGSIKEAFPQYLGGLEYSETSIRDMQNEKWDLPPEAIDLNAIAAQLNLPEWYKVPEVWNWESLVDAMALSEYMDWQFENRSSPDTALPDDEIVQYGASIYYDQSPSILRQKEEFNETTQELIESEWDIFSETVNDYLKRAGVENYDSLSVDQKFELGIQIIERKDEYYLNYDIDAAELELEQLGTQLDEAKSNRGVALSDSYYTEDDTEFQQLDEECKALENRISVLQHETLVAGYLQDKSKYDAILEEPDFAEYSAKGEALVNDTSGWGLEIAGWTPFWDIQNKVKYGRENYFGLALSVCNGSYGSQVAWMKYYFMTDDEYAIYNYLLAKDKEDETSNSDAYLDSIEEILNYRQGTQLAENISDKPVLQYLYAIPAGLDQFGSGIRQLFSSERLPTSATQFASSAIYEDLADDGFKLPDWMGGASIGQAAYSFGTGLANMAPAILLTALTGGLGAPAAFATGVGAVTMGLSAKGNAYNWALGQGYTKEQAGTYSTMIGVSEAALQYITGGISALGGKLTGNIIKNLVSKIDSALLRVAISMPIRMAGEGAEEYLQQTLEPVYRNIAFDENNEFRIWTEDAMYSFMLGAFTAGVLETGPAIKHDITASKAGDAVLQAQQDSTLIQNALTLDPKTEAYQLAEKLANGTIKASNYNVGTLMMEYVNAGGDASFMYTPSPEMVTQGHGPAEVQTITYEAADVQLSQEVADSIQNNVQANPEGVQAALTEGMTALIGIETRVQRESGNVNHQGINIEASHNAYMDFVSGKGSVEVAAMAMAGDIRAAVATGGLTASEVSQLQGVLAGIVGSAELATAYMGQVVTATVGVDVSGTVQAVGIVPIEDENVLNMDEGEENGYNGTKDAGKFDFNKYLRKMKGNPPVDMVDPHAHHILFKEGLGDAQKALVKEGQALLRRYGIDPIWGLENLVWAPNRIKGQHGIEALRYVIEKLKLVEDFGGSYNDIVEALEDLGEKAAKRRK